MVDKTTITNYNGQATHIEAETGLPISSFHAHCLQGASCIDPLVTKVSKGLPRQDQDMWRQWSLLSLSST